MLINAKSMRDLQSVATVEIKKLRLEKALEVTMSTIHDYAMRGLNRITIGPEVGTTINMHVGNKRGSELERQLRNEFIAKLIELGYYVETSNEYPGHKLTVDWFS